MTFRVLARHVVLCVGALLGIVFVAGGCSTVVEEDASSLADLTSRPDVNAMIDKNFVGACAFAKVFASQGEPFCKDAPLESGADGPGQLITDVCGQGQATVNASIRSLLASDLATKMKVNRSGSDVPNALELDFRDAIYKCFNGQAIRNEEAKRQVAEDPKLQAMFQVGRDRLWHRVARGVGRGIARSAKPMGEMRVTTSLRNLLLAGVCTSASSAVSGFLEASATGRSSTAERDPCSFDWDRERAAACVATVGSICSAGAGFVDLHATFGDDQALESYVIDGLNVGIEALCRSGGPVASVACGSINAAAEQIAKAVRTGNNDWARCLGIDQLGTCLATKLSSEKWTNNAGYETARSTVGANGASYNIIGCCRCTLERVTEETRFASSRDSIDSVENWVAPIQKGDFSSGNCGVQEGKVIVDSETGSLTSSVRRLRRYSECGRIEAVGGRCSFRKKEGDGSFRDAPLTLWDSVVRLPGETISRARP